MDYDQYETAKQLAELIEIYRFDSSHPSIQNISEYFFHHQTPIGDIRGIYANQFSPNYTAMIIELLVKAGYKDDKRVVKAMDWLISDRQQDGGWALAFRTKGHNLGAFDLKNTVEADYKKPSSAMVTGVVLRAMAAHPKYRNLDEVRQAARFLADSIFTAEKYPDRKSKDFWTRFGFPFIYTDLLSALDSLSLIGGFEKHPKVLNGMQWLEDRQNCRGSFDNKITRGNKAKQEEWMTFVVCRMYKRFFSE